MKKEELIEVIRTIVKEEMEKSLPDVLVEILASKVSEREVVTEKEEFSPTIRRKSLVKLEEPVGIVRPAPTKTYSKNPVLNQILNETQGGIPPEDEESASPSVLDTIKTLPKEVISENTAIKAVAGALTRDYRTLLKAVDAKAKSQRP